MNSVLLSLLFVSITRRNVVLRESSPQLPLCRIEHRSGLDLDPPEGATAGYLSFNRITFLDQPVTANAQKG